MAQIEKESIGKKPQVRLIMEITKEDGTKRVLDVTADNVLLAYCNDVDGLIDGHNIITSAAGNTMAFMSMEQAISKMVQKQVAETLIESKSPLSRVLGNAMLESLRRREENDGISDGHDCDTCPPEKKALCPKFRSEKARV